MNIKTEAEARLHMLRKRINTLERELARCPEGNLYCKKDKNAVFYYDRTITNGTKKTVYIAKDNSKLIRKLAHRKDIEKVLPALRKELSCLQSFSKSYSGATEEEIASHINPLILDICDDIRSTRESRIKEWLSNVSSGANDLYGGPSLPTDSGLKVRSKSEVLIANCLDKYGIPFQYEKPLFLDGTANPLYPDFTILNPNNMHEIIWEHFGMMDNPEYAANACKKIALYMQNGYIPGKNLIITFETATTPLTLTIIKKCIQMISEM